MLKKPKLLTLLFLTCSFFTHAQENAISISSFNVNKQLPANIKEWGSTPAALLLVAQNNKWGDRPVKLLIAVKKGDSKICGIADGITVDYFKAHSFGTNELLAGLGNCETLPPGDYTLCVRFRGMGDTRQWIDISPEVCKPFTVDGGTNNQKYTGPVFISPENNKIFTEQDFKKPLTFRWTPVVPKPQEPVTYRLKVWQLMQGQNGTQAMKVNQPILTKDVDNITQAIVTNLLTGPCKPPYLCDFVWAVQAMNKEGKAYGESDMGNFNVQYETQNNTPATNISCAVPVINYPENGTAFNKSANSIDVRGTVYGESKNILLKLYKISNDPNLVNDLRQKSKSIPVFSPLEMFDYKGAAKTMGLAEKTYDVKIEQSGNNSNIFSAKIPAADLEHGSYYIIAENGNCSSGALAFSMSAGCGTNTDSVIIRCKDWVNGLPTYTVTIIFKNIPPITGGQFCSTVMNSITAGSGTISGIATLPVTIPSNGSAPAVTFTYTVATATQTNVTFNYTGIWNDGNSNTSNFNSGAIALPGCVCNACDGLQWNNTTTSSSLQGNNFNIVQAVNSVASGLGIIVAAKAEIIAFERYVGDSCVSCNKDYHQWGNFSAGIYAGNNGSPGTAIAPVTGNTTHSLYWNAPPNGSFPLNSSFNLNISTPPLSNLACCCDRVAVTIRFTFSFKDPKTGICKMCSFVKRYEQKKGNCSNGNDIPADIIQNPAK